jgi:hypothetical protein
MRARRRAGELLEQFDLVEAADKEGQGLKRRDAAPVTVPIVSTATAVISMRSTSGGSAHGIGSCSREM